MSGAHPESSGTGRDQRPAVVGTTAIRHYYRQSMKPTGAQSLRQPPLLLEGGNEFRGAMEEADRAALKCAGPGRVAVVPAAAVSPEASSHSSKRSDTVGPRAGNSW